MLTLRSVVTALRCYHGKPSGPISRDPFHLILWEQVAYLVPDVERRRAFSTLRATVGLTPPAILRAASTKLEKITRLGGPIAASARASRLRESAELVLGRWDGDLRAALRGPARPGVICDGNDERTTTRSALQSLVATISTNPRWLTSPYALLR